MSWIQVSSWEGKNFCSLMLPGKINFQFAEFWKLTKLNFLRYNIMLKESCLLLHASHVCWNLVTPLWTMKDIHRTKSLYASQKIYSFEKYFSSQALITKIYVTVSGYMSHKQINIYTDLKWSQSKITDLT